jgi:hypothetical protein
MYTIYYIHTTGVKMEKTIYSTILLYTINETSYINMDFDRFVRDFWMGGGGDFIAEFLVLHLHSSSFFIILHHSSLISV